MIVLDTHIWIWWVHGDPKLSQTAKIAIESHESLAIGISVISCWEIAKLVEYNRLTLPCEISEWFEKALSYPAVQLLDLTPQIAITSTQLVNFHCDPADQIITATAKVYDCPLVTMDTKILGYANVVTIS
ncbi:MAG: type II toxin-antitoxin system VapC family toxin [Pseudanabaena sp. M57BS1SP1A06MG]|jgi:PIN domain nuclease of toxin-antitoxin system|nr:type II toxin-antitoxin system VapC family toxin [Pseudanabaena sp. M53BS1SP1A06MG]MCA6581967.1 type II toxin-antitoxin system VapC family toxin [Pseudanabaena sp. M34BS1SP1A06MG]MCA6592277.1 type II toxin-antitoxin system VapC family toxin [Pseudanabaena sp. M38BS1SP1A06MG]MCA6599492.1 type II toxin-antitoxin system VapC family toxin [Pseudanabaena sp. M57BS1SP1A06MG]